MSRTTDNLMKVFQECAEASARYLAFAQVAKEEGQPEVAKLLRAVAKTKVVHAISHYRAANMVDSTEENLNLAIEEETYDFKAGYPRMVDDAVADEALNARHSLEYGMSIGPELAKWMSKALGGLDTQEDGAYYICPVCGHLEFKEAPAKCPFCGVDAAQFIEVS